MALSGFGANKLFEGIPPDHVEALALAPRVVEVPRGTVIFEEGDPAEAMFLIGRGRVQISKRGRGGKQETLTYLERDEFFGEMALYDPAPRSARATAAEDSILGRVGLAEFQGALVHAPPRLHLNLTRWTIRRLRDNDHLLIDQLLAAERLSLVGSMAAMILHDFKNPIGVIRGATELLQETSTDATHTRLAAMIDRSVDAMLTMIQELLDYSRGMGELHVEPIPLSYLFAELEEQALRAIRARGIAVERPATPAGFVRVDRGRFLRALLNIVRNAGEVLQPGGRLRITVERDGEWASFAVSDDGPGIAEDLLPRIFEPFVTRGKAQGTGLGLTIAKAAVEAHGGTITAASAVGAGTSFVIRIPSAEVDAPRAPLRLSAQP